MSSIIYLPKNMYSTFSSLGVAGNANQSQWNSAYIKQKVHERRIDEFFWTDLEAEPKKQSIPAIIGSFLGVIIPTIYFAKKQKPEIKLDSLKNIGKNIFKTMDIDYGLSQILTVGIGGIAGGLLGGLVDRNEKDKLQKIEEASFQTMNIAIPAILAEKALKICDKSKRFNNNFSKILFTVLTIPIGVVAAVGISNKLDDKFFDKYNKDPERKFKAKDLIVHVDDLLGTFVLAKMPFVEYLHVNKILPAVFAWSGYHVGNYKD